MLTPSSAFVAASRRKDRSLDARLESAHRASGLHKERTGKALRITKEIVETEAMYEEVDEHYEEKRIRIQEAQNNQVDLQFRRNLLALSTRNFNARQAQGLDLSAGPPAFSPGMQQGPLTSPGFMGSQYVPSPGTYDQSMQSSYMSMNSSLGGSEMPSYMGQQIPQWQPQPPFGSWADFGQHVPQADMSMRMPMQPFTRERLASAPEIQPLRSSPPPAATPSHTRGRSVPNLSANFSALQGESAFPNMRTLSDTPSLGQSTPDGCATPTTPASPPRGIRENSEGAMVSHDRPDPDFAAFVEFSKRVDVPTASDDMSGFYDVAMLDDYSTTPIFSTSQGDQGDFWMPLMAQ
ncbi:hypothetical protein PHISP_06075 [Aspergillus sp. HF37]|nr:hypothetical protein PHISP_06075 [Aspergillus sp. HF37]